MKESYTANRSPIRRRTVVRQHESSVACFIVLAASLAIVGCSDPGDPEQPGATDAANDEDMSSEEDKSFDERETYPTFKECLAATSAEECEQEGCFVLNNFGAKFHEYTEADGCREGGDELLCSDFSGGDASTGFFWRERADGTAVTWSFSSVVWPFNDDTWRWCDVGGDVPAHPVCRCNEFWAEEKEPRGD